MTTVVCHSLCGLYESIMCEIHYAIPCLVCLSSVNVLTKYCCVGVAHFVGRDFIHYCSVFASYGPGIIHPRNEFAL